MIAASTAIAASSSSRCTRAGPAAVAGLLQNDVILSINGEPIMTERQALLLVAAAKPGDELDLLVWRNGEHVELNVVATERTELPL